MVRSLGAAFSRVKIWFLLRSYGLDNLRERIRNHVNWSCEIADKFRGTTDFEVVTDPILSLFTFRYVPDTDQDLDILNQKLVDAINDDGRIYLTQTIHKGQKLFVFRLVNLIAKNRTSKPPMMSYCRLQRI